ncbi:MAG: carbohydrate ABC transporter permease [Clostridiales bacterium]|jgi:putative aldouronate transport system permease protein|nr:carbohydrate ABC transporter permease [Clostridiales bacterium]
MFTKNTSKVGDAVIVFICVIFIVICLAPILNIFSRSVSSSSALVSGRVSLWPIGFNLDSLKMVWEDPKYTTSLGWTAILTIICTIFSLFITVVCAYPFVYNNLKGRKFLNGALIFTMYFNAGTIPNYLLMKSLGLLENPLVLIIPSCLSVYNMILMRSFFYGISDSLRESAEIDGAGPIKVLTSIYLPLSKPVLATIALFYAVGRWNGYGDALIYIIREKQWFPIQLLLYNIIQNSTQSIEISRLEGFSLPGVSESIKAATVIFATVPILLIYPWLQKYFVKGVTLGAIKE